MNCDSSKLQYHLYHAVIVMYWQNISEHIDTIWRITANTFYSKHACACDHHTRQTHRKTITVMSKKNFTFNSFLSSHVLPAILKIDINYHFYYHHFYMEYFFLFHVQFSVILAIIFFLQLSLAVVVFVFQDKVRIIIFEFYFVFK